MVFVGERLKNFFEEKLHFQSEVCRCWCFYCDLFRLHCL